MSDREETTHELLRLMIRALADHRQQLKNTESRLIRIENRIDNLSTQIGSKNND